MRSVVLLVLALLSVGTAIWVGSASNWFVACLIAGGLLVALAFVAAAAEVNDAEVGGRY